MNNKPIDLKSVLFTLNQLQATLEVLSQRVQPAPHGAYEQAAYGGAVSTRLSQEDLREYPRPEKNRI